MEEQRKEREQKRKRHVYRVISGQTEKKNRGDSKVNESLGNLF